MSSSSGPSTCRRSARSRNVSESSEASWLGSDSKNVASSSEQFRCPADPGSPSDNSPDRVKRKKRRKNVYNFSLEVRKKIIKNRVVVFNRRQKLEEKLIRVKLKDNRTPFVLLTRLDNDHHSQPKPKEEVEKKEEKVEEKKEERVEVTEEKVEEPRVQLPGLTIPAKVDPKILKHGLVIKINKEQTESLIEVSKRLSQRQLKTDASDEKQEKESAGSVLSSDLDKCAKRLTEKLEICLSDDNRCTKNVIVSNSGRRLTRITIDKGNNDRLPEKLLEGDSKCMLNSITEASVDESQPKSSKSFIHSNRRLKRNLVDQNNYKHSIDLVESKPKCMESIIEKIGEKHPEGKDVTKYSKNLSKGIENHSTDKSSKKYLEVSDNNHEKSVLFAVKETNKEQSDIPSEITKKVSVILVENNTRPRRNLASKNTEQHGDDSVESSSESSLKKSKEKLSEKADKIIQEDFTNHKIVTRKISDKNDDHAESTLTNVDGTEKPVSVIPSENTARSRRNLASKCSQQHADDSVESSSESSLKKPKEKLSEKVDKIIQEDSKNHKMVIRKISDKNDDHAESAVKNVDNTEKPVSVIPSENTARPKRNLASKSSEQHVDDSMESSSESTLKKPKEKLSEKVDKIIQEDSKNHKMVTRKISDKNDYHAESAVRNVDNTEKPVSIIPSESNARLRRNLASKSSEQHVSDSVESSSESSSKKPNEKLSEKVDKTIQEDSKNHKMVTRKITDKNDGHTESAVKNVDSTKKPVECNIKLSKKLDKKINECSKNETENNKKIRRKANDKSERCGDNFIEYHVNFVENFVKECENFPDEVDKNIQVCVKNETERSKRNTRNVGDKSDEPAEKAHETSLNCTQTVKQSDRSQSQDVDKNKQKYSKNLNENNRRITKNSEKSIHFVEENSENLSKNFDGKVKKVSKKTVQHFVESKNENFDEKVKNVSENSIQFSVKDKSEDVSKNLDEEVQTISKISDENFKSLDESVTKVLTISLGSKKRFTRKLVNKNNKKLGDTSIEVQSDSNQNSIEHNKIHVSKESKKVSQNLAENNQRSRRKLPNKSNEILSDPLTENTPVSSEDSVEKHNEKLNENLNKNIDERSKTQIEIDKRKTRRLTERRGDLTENSVEDKIDHTHLTEKCSETVPEKLNTNIKDSSMIQTEIVKKSRRKLSPDKSDKNSEILAESNLDFIQNSVEESKEDFLKESQKKIKDCLRTQTENKLITRKLAQKNENHATKLIESNSDSMQSAVQESKKNPNELHKNTKETIKTTESKREARKSSLDKNEKRVENSLNKILESTQTYVEEIKKNISEVSGKHVNYFKIPNENKMVTRNTSSYKNEKYSESLMKNKLDYVQNGIDKNEENLSVEVIDKVKESFKIQIKSKMVTRKTSFHKHDKPKPIENLTKNEDECLQNNINGNEDIVSGDSPRNAKANSKNQVENKKVSRILSPDAHEKRDENFIKNNSDSIQDVNKNGAKFLEESQKIIKESTKRVARKSSPNKHERQTGSVAKSYSDCPQNTNEKIEDKFIDEQQKVIKEIKECSKIPIEDNKRVTRKLSPNKHERRTESTATNNANFTQNSEMKNDDNLIEAQEKIVKECSKSQTENNKRVTRKSSPDKHERHNESLIVNNLDSVQNGTDKNDEILSERLDNKENSKTQIEINTRSTRNSSFKKDKYSKNLTENNLDCAQTLSEENKERSSENMINNVKLISKNASDISKVSRKNSEDKINEIHIESLVETNSVYLQNSTEDINDKQFDSSNENCIQSAKDFENNRSARNLCEKIVIQQPQNVVETNFPSAQCSVSSSEKYSTTLEKSNKKCATNFIENNKRVTRQSSDKISEFPRFKNDSQNEQAIISEISENERQSETVDESNEICPKTMIKSEINKNLVEDKSFVNAESLDENNETCTQMLIESGSDKESNKGMKICAQKSIENNAVVIQEVSAEQSFQKDDENYENTVDKNNKSDLKPVEETAVRSSKRIALRAALKNSENHSEAILEKISKSIENSIEHNNDYSENYNENKIHSSRKSPENCKDVSHSTGNANMDSEGTKVQENSAEVTAENHIQDLHESIDHSSEKCAEKSKIVTRYSLNRTDEISAESLVEDKNTGCIENPIEKIQEAHSQNLYENNKDCTNNSMQNDASSELISENTSECILKLTNKLIEDCLNNPKISPKRITRNIANKMEEAQNCIKENPEKVENVANYNNEVLSKIPIDENAQNAILDESNLEDETFAKHRRKLTLLELKKKCTENLGKKRAASLERLSKITTNSPARISIDENVDSSMGTEMYAIGPSLDSCADVMTESDENYVDSLSGADSDENLADRLAQLNSLDTPLDSFVTTEPSAQGEQRQVEKIVLKYPRLSIFEINAHFLCKYCTEIFSSGRELKKHIKVQHRQRLVIKITKTDVNQHVTHIVQPVLNPTANHANNEQLVEEESQVENDTSVTPPMNVCTEEPPRSSDKTEEEAEDKITEGEIKIIVKKESGSKNSHVVKEIKITPKSGDSNRVPMPGWSPTKSDVGSGSSNSSSYRMPCMSPANFDYGQPVKRRPGRPRKYPIFTESELIAKQIGEITPPNPIVNNGGLTTFSNDNHFLKMVESIVVQPDISFNNRQNVVLECKSMLGDKSPISSTKNNVKYRSSKKNNVNTQITMSEHSSINCGEPKKSICTTVWRAGEKRKRLRSISSDIPQESYRAPEVVDPVTEELRLQVSEDMASKEKKRKVSEDTGLEEKKGAVCEDDIEEQSGSKVSDDDVEDESTFVPLNVSANETDLLVKYSIKKDLVVRLTKIDSVPKVSKEFNANVNDFEQIDDNSVPKAEERPRRKTKPKVAIDEEETSRREPIKSVIRQKLKNKLENNNNNVNDIEKCLDAVSSSSPPKTLQEVLKDSAEVEGEATAEVSQEEAQGTNDQQLDHKTSEAAMSKSGEDDGNNTLETLADNQNTVSESQLVVTPRRQTIDKAEADGSQKAKLLMLMNATTPYETVNNVVSTTTVTESPQPQSPPPPPPAPPPPPPPPPMQLQPHTLQLQPQMLQLPQAPHQFCILFIPDTLYNPDSPMSRDMTPTATIVNFQPVPDNEMANKSLIFTPTTPTKISIDEHAKSYVCTTCTEVSDLIGRLEASLGMTEEDKSAIKCPYCSNHFQSLFYLEYHVMQEHLKCENEKQCRHSGFNSLRIPTHEAASEFEIYITFALKCRSCYDIFNTVLMLNDHVMYKHKSLVRLKPSLPSSSTSGGIFSAYPEFGRKNGRSALLACPSDCVCRIGIRSTDSPLQRQQMLKRCPNAMRRLEKIEPAAYEVYTCTLCKSTFLMKDEVVDHLMKMHEVSCKFPCYTCLTSFRTLQLQENHVCSETTLQDIDKLLNIAILPTNVGGNGGSGSGSGKGNNKYMEREDSSTDEYGAIKTSVAVIPKAPYKNGFKRKNGVTVATLNDLLGATVAKKAKIGNSAPVPPMSSGRKRKRACPKCKKRFTYRKSLHDHIIYEHILKSQGDEGPKKTAVELLTLMSTGRASGKRVEELAERLKGCTDEDGVSFRSLMMIDENEQENWEETHRREVFEKDLTQCARCKEYFKLPGSSGNLKRHNNHHQSSGELKLYFCTTCESNGPKTRRRTVVNNGHHDEKVDPDSTTPQSQEPKVVYPYSCRKCTETFPSAVELKSHKRSVHAKLLIDKLHTCDICKKSFSSSRMLDKHKKIHRESVLDESAKTEEEEIPRSSQNVGDNSKDGEANDSLNDKADSSSRRDSSDSSSAGSKEPEEQPLNCSFCEEVCSSKVSLKNHLKREHGRRASICQFCNGLLIDTSEVRHMLDYHIVPSKSSSRRTIMKSNGSIIQCEASCMQDDVDELIRILGKHRLQSLMMYHDFEGKCNNAIMRCPICPELFATRESCRFHYVWIHDDSCLLCDETFRSGSSACQHKVDAHTSTASYLWCIQRLVTAIVNTLRLDPNQPSYTLYQMIAMRVEEENAAAGAASESMIVRSTTEKGSTEESTAATERFLEEVVLSEDQLPDSSNIIEVVIGKEDSEDDLLSMLNLSPNYESCEQHRLPNAGSAPPEEEEEDYTSVASAPTTPLLSTTAATTMLTPTMTTMTTMMTTAAAATSPVVENYVTSGVCKYRLDNDEEQLVLVVTDEDLVTYRDDIGSLAERISATCDSLTLEEITEMLRAYFESVNASSGAGA